MHLAGARGSEFQSLQRFEPIKGSVDDFGRPLIRIEVPGFSDPLLAVIDTGFNGAILIDGLQANKLGFKEANIRTPVELASQHEVEFLLGRGTFPWFGENKAIWAYVLIETQEMRRARIARKKEDEILIGTELLSACRLEIDFPARKVLITKLG